jgi:hypothetical protein
MMDNSQYNKLDSKIDRVETKVDNNTQVLLEVASHTAANTASLQQHMAQTQEVRKQTQMLFQGLEAMQKDAEARIKPIEIVIDRIKFSGVILGTLGGALLGLHELGILPYLLKLLSGHSGQ